MRSNIRAGFTLVELMVAMALTLFIMVILSQAFVIALDTFASLKAIGDMQGNLRVANVLLTNDLSNDHLPGNVRLSDITETGLPAIVSQRPLAGFFAVLQGSTAVNAIAGNAQTGLYVREGIDASGFESLRATNHVLYMTVKRKGNRPENFFTASLPMPAASVFFTKQTSYTMDPVVDLPPATYADDPRLPNPFCAFNSQWAEVIYYLVQTGTTEEPNNPSSSLGIPLFSLMRAEFVMVTDGTNLAGQISNAGFSTFYNVSCNQNLGTGTLDFYSPADAANGARIVPDITKLIVSATGRVDIETNSLVRPVKPVATLVLPNVTSFQVQVMLLMPPNNTTFIDVPGRVFDSSRPTNTNGLKGVQVTLRVFEPKTRQTRQMTIVQDL